MLSAGAVLTAGMTSCMSDGDAVLSVLPIVGEWKSCGDAFFELHVEGSPVTLLEFGTEVLGFGEAIAEEEARAYLQQQILGPLDLDDPNLVIDPQGTFIALFPQGQLEGSWQLINAQRTLVLKTSNQISDQYDFEVQRLLPGTLELKKSLTIYRVGQEALTFRVEVMINLVESCA